MPYLHGEEIITGCDGNDISVIYQITTTPGVNYHTRGSTNNC